MCGCCRADVLIQLKEIRTNRRLARLVLASIACFLSLRNLSSCLGDGGWGFTGRTRKIKYAQLYHPCLDTIALTFYELFARRGNLPNQTDDLWTTFEMDLREPAPIPAVFDFTRFLVSSITFMAHLREVSVYFDDKRLVHLTKDTDISNQLIIPQGLNPTSPMGFMKIKGLKSIRKWFIVNHNRSILTVVIRYSTAYYRGSCGLGL